MIDAKEAVLLNAHEHFLWTYITSVVIQADDLSNPKAKIRVTTPASQTSPETIYKSLQDCLGYFNVEAFTPVGQPFAPSAPIPVDVTACRNPHTFYLLVKVLNHLAEAPESVKDIVDSRAAKSQLILHLSMPFGLQYAQKDLTVELFVRETLLKLGGESQWTLLGLMMEKKLADGDRNWSTILTLIQASYGWATGSTEVPTKRTEITEAMEPAVPGNWWNKEEPECSDSPGIGRLIRAKCLLERLGSDEGFSKKDRGFTLGLLRMASWYPTRIQSNFPGAFDACLFSRVSELTK